ncbi:MAG: hypothetical protein F6K56_10595 [Moorea sp. SIO3G5]|nr:hypothetical protein [Moorena sp. SIO3G5]
MSVRAKPLYIVPLLLNNSNKKETLTIGYLPIYEIPSYQFEPLLLMSKSRHKVILGWIWLVIDDELDIHIIYRYKGEIELYNLEFFKKNNPYFENIEVIYDYPKLIELIMNESYECVKAVTYTLDSMVSLLKAAQPTYPVILGVSI